MGKNHDTILSRENKNHKNAGRIVGERNIASAATFLRLTSFRGGVLAPGGKWRTIMVAGRGQ